MPPPVHKWTGIDLHPLKTFSNLYGEPKQKGRVKMEGVIQLVGISPEVFKEEVRSIVAKEIKELKDDLISHKPDELMTRADVADLFEINIGTVRNWSRAGKLIPHPIGRRVYFKRSEIDEVMKTL